MTAQSPESTPKDYERFAQFGETLKRVLKPLSEGNKSRAHAAIEQIRTGLRDVGGIFGKQEGLRVLVVALHEIFSDRGFPGEPTVHFKYEAIDGKGYYSSQTGLPTSWKDIAPVLRDQDDLPLARYAIETLHGDVNTLRRIDGISTQGAADITVAVLDKETNPRPIPLYTFEATVEPPSPV